LLDQLSFIDVCQKKSEETKKTQFLRIVNTYIKLSLRAE